jgi:hypothetical protein
MLSDKSAQATTSLSAESLSANKKTYQYSQYHQNLVQSKQYLSMSLN